MTKPFAGVRILDFTRYLAGPYGTYQLALLGADVVKIESREGDESRGLLVDRTWAERKMAPSFLAVNGNKRSITLDLRRPEAVEVVKRLAVGADVVWENFRPGVMDRLSSWVRPACGRGYHMESMIVRGRRVLDFARRGAQFCCGW
jgi:crotonobetainyl-CoA:carnitine CoA-transferase CaiB-like acyl-CoA transferase